ncbi:MAG: S8 family serine peptidase, partial [Methylobacteriaceae bacterium]|nr:S8 family serine peptidase [Methylobacteriaceae bacterium]
FVRVDLGTGTWQIAIENLSGPNPTLIKDLVYGDSNPADVSISGANAGTVFGHHMSPDAIAVGAVDSANTPAFGVSPPKSEDFSSSGVGTQLWFNFDGTALPSPLLLNPVAVSGIDDIETTVPGGLGDFFGTSAATPSVAAVAALMLQGNSLLNPTDIKSLLEDSAVAAVDPTTATANPEVSGTGLVQANLAVAFAETGIISGSHQRTLVGTHLNDVFIPDPAIFVTMTGGGGNDTFQSTIGGFNGDTITDGHVGDKIVFTDANLATFAYTWSGTTLHYASTHALNLPNNPIGHFILSVDPTSGVDVTLAPENPALQDFTGGGTSDLLWQNTNGSTGTWEIGNGLKTGGTDLGPISGVWTIGGTGDFTFNHTSDLLFRNNSTGDVATWEITNGSKSGSTDLGPVPLNWQILGVGDFNHDGTGDILWRNNSNNDLGTWELQNGVKTGGADLGIAASTLRVVGIGDFNGDGTSDVLLRDISTGDAKIWEVQNGAKSGTTDLGVVPLAWHVEGVGDFNGDGTSDILWRSDNGDVGTWELTNGLKTGGTDLGNVSNAWHIVGVGDYYDNGTADILWRNDSGDTGIWQIKNGLKVGGTDLGVVPTSWHIIEPHFDFV